MPSVSRFLRGFGTKDKQETEYIEFDAIIDDGRDEPDANQQRLNSIWRNDTRSTKHSDITHHVQKQEYEPKLNANDKTYHKDAKSHGARSMPVIMHEHIINTTNQFNKVFASAFVSEDIVTFGTKDNKLMLLDVVKGKICQIRLPNAEKSFDYNRTIDAVIDKENSDKACGIHDLKFNTNNNLLITGGHKPQDVAIFRYDNDVHHIGPKKFSHTLIPLANLKFHKDWIFAMDFVDDKHIVAGGRDGQLSIWDISNIDKTYQDYRSKHNLKVYGPNSNDNSGYNINPFEELLNVDSNASTNNNHNDGFATNFSELQESLLNHDNDNDWSVFNSDGAPVDEQHVSQLREKQKNMTVSQDRCNVPILRKPVHFACDTDHRIRALKSFSKSSTLSHSQCVVTLATTGEVQIFDISRSKSLLKEFLPHRKETVCVEINQDKGQIIVGSQSHIQIFDPRCELSQSLQVIDSLDKNWGCRTISCYTDLLTIGGGLGRLSFYDLRASKYMECAPKHKSLHGKKSEEKLAYRTIDKGWVKEDDVYQNIFAMHSLPRPTAVYTHCYNPQRSKLFAAGGPTPYGLCGSAASVYF